jgi:hypothetical protein
MKADNRQPTATEKKIPLPPLIKGEERGIFFYALWLAALR